MTLRLPWVDPFLVAMLAAVVIGLVAPELGFDPATAPTGHITSAGIAFVFFVHGAALSPGALRAGVANWRLHIAIQATTFVFFPLLGLLLLASLGGVLPLESRLGLFFLCALASTVSTSVAMTALARGNVAGAIFNASLSGVLGMIVTPFLVSLVAPAALGEIAVLPATLEIAKTLLLPFAAGQLVRPLVGEWIARNKRWTTLADRSVILLIVFLAFAQSAASNVWAEQGLGSIVLVMVITSALLAAALLFTRWLGAALRMSRADTVALVFCGSKKSLANGAPIAAVLFGDLPELGAIVLPILVYHQLQLVVGAILARRYALAETPAQPVL